MPTVIEKFIHYFGLFEGSVSFNLAQIESNIWFIYHCIFDF